MWLAAMFGFGVATTDVEFGIQLAAATYLIPFGGLFCSYMVAYYEWGLYTCVTHSKNS